MKKILFISINIIIWIISVTVVGLGQGIQGKLTSNWACGDSIGIDFNTSPPSFFPCMNSCEPHISTDLNGCNGTFSDSSGKMLFYFQGKFPGYRTIDGETYLYWKACIYNFNNELMLNGDSIKADINGTVAIILPCPEKSGIYYVFTILDELFPKLSDPRNYSKKTQRSKPYYHVIDMNRNNGNGEVISKNIVLSELGTRWDPAACKHANGIDWWYVTHDSDSSRTYRRYLLTKDGIDTTEYTQDIGFLYGFNYLGYKEGDSLIAISITGGSDFSSDGSKYVLSTITGAIELYEFDRCTGCLHHRRNLTDRSIMNQYEIGSRNANVLFSRDGKKMYVNFMSFFYQFDLEKGTKMMIDTSHLIRHHSGPYNEFGRFLFHPYENKIVVPEFSRFYRKGVDTFNIINNPDGELGDIGYQRGWLTAPEKRNFCWGMPTYPNYALGPLIPTRTRMDTVICRRTELSLGSDHECPYNYSWSGMKVRDSTVKILTHEFDSTGVYKFWRHRYSIAQGCTTAIDTFMVIVKTTAPPCATALEEHSKPKTKVKIYPNPAQEVVMIAANQRILLIRFYDMNGKVVKEEIPATSTQTFESDVQHLPHGIYLLQVETDGGSVTQKVVVE